MLSLEYIIAPDEPSRPVISVSALHFELLGSLDFLSLKCCKRFLYIDVLHRKVVFAMQGLPTFAVNE